MLPSQAFNRPELATPILAMENSRIESGITQTMQGCLLTLPSKQLRRLAFGLFGGKPKLPRGFPLPSVATDKGRPTAHCRSNHQSATHDNRLLQAQPA